MKTIKVTKRTQLGKKNKQLRRTGVIPAVIYNAKTESIPISIDLKDAQKIVRSSSSTTIITLDDGKKKYSALVRDFDIDPKTDQLRHISFFEIVKGTTIDINVPVELTGISPAVKNNLGVLFTPKTHILLRCPSENIPEKIIVDISGLEKVGQTILIDEITLPEGSSLVHQEDKHKAVASITSLQKQIEVAETTEAEGEESEEETTEESDETTTEETEATTE